MFFIFLSLWNTCKHWFLYIKSTLMTSVVLYSLTRATLMSPGKDETRFCGYIRSEFIHWVLWRTLMRTVWFLFIQHTSILAKLSTWGFEHSGDISCSLLVNPSHIDESWEGQNTCLWIDIEYIYAMRHCLLPGTFSGKFAFVSLWKTSETFLALALPGRTVIIGLALAMDIPISP